MPASGGAHDAFYDYRDDGTIAAIYAGWSVVPASFTGLAWNYEYDDAGRLTRERRAEYDGGSIVATALDQQYAYDAAGNRLSRTGSGTGHEAMGAVGGHDMHNDMHQLEHYALGALAHVRRAYDDAGNTTRHWDTAGTPAFDWNTTWSADHRLTYAQNAVTGGKKVRYVYDWQGRRLQRTDETHAQAHLRTRYYFHGLTPLAERASDREFDDVMGWGYWTWSTSRLNTLAPGQYGHVVVQRNGGTDRYLHYDHVGNVVAESSTSGVFAAQHEQDAFGRPVLSSAAGGWSHNALHMTTKDYDADAGMFYFYQRWYDRNTGTFGSMAHHPRWSEHPYSHSRNDPHHFVDPRGEKEMPRGSATVVYDHPEEQSPRYVGCGGSEIAPNLPAFGDLAIAIGLLSLAPSQKRCIEEQLAQQDITCNDDSATCKEEEAPMGHAGLPWTIDRDAHGVPINRKHRGGGITLCPGNIDGKPGCNDVASLADLIVHEAAHTCGFDHKNGEVWEPWVDSGLTARIDCSR